MQRHFLESGIRWTEKGLLLSLIKIRLYMQEYIRTTSYASRILCLCMCSEVTKFVSNQYLAGADALRPYQGLFKRLI